MLKYDRQIKISTGQSRHSKYWNETILSLQELYEKLSVPSRGAETYSQYLSYPKSQQDALKDVGGYVGGSLISGIRKNGHIAGRDILTLDLDNIKPEGTEEIIKRVEALGCGYCIYSTRKHSPATPRLRLIIPIDRTVSADEYEALARKTAAIIDNFLAPFDPTTFEPTRLMYWPSCSSDSEYIYTFSDKPLLSADGVLKMYADWHDYTSWPQVAGAEVKPKQLALKQGNPTDKRGVIGAFCRVYDIYNAMEAFLPGVYIPTDLDDRYTYSGGSTTGGAVIYEDGQFLFSHHATDPCGGKLVNSFDLVRLHLFGDLDDEAKPDTPTNKLPSYSAMCKRAVETQEVQSLMDEERYESATDDFKSDDTTFNTETNTDNKAWMKSLTRNYNTGAYEKTTNNVLLILENDPLIKNRIVLDTFANRGYAVGPYPWDKSDKPRSWTDNDDAGIRWYIEKVYNITGKDKIMDAVSMCANNHAFDPVQDYLTGLVWDGINRLDTLLIDYLGATDNLYTREVTRKAFTAAVARAIVPGIKFDNMTIITGPQGIGKSTLLKKLGRQWFSDSLTSFAGKDARELIQGSWIIEVGELTAFSKSENEQVKQFLSQCEDIYRAPYGRRTNVYPRRCIFFGTSNKLEFLRDQTGGRRFWPIDTGINKPTKSVFKNLDKQTIDMIWAEALTRFRLGEQLFLSEQAENFAKAEQESHRDMSPREGMIRDFVEMKVPSDWNTRSLEQRRLYLNGMGSPTNDLIARDRISAIEVWCECFNGDPKQMKYSDAQEINGILNNMQGYIKSKNLMRYGPYGPQRGFKKI